MLDNDLRPLITKKSLGKLESFGHKLIKKQPYLDSAPYLISAPGEYP